ncbi:DNA-binding transcriptional LysR family regulator [Sporomusaceae bacterium BoRhaA]|uniref:LysR family transcriptional regulator n=1 Tax=Pelorhabdus rhamnosifermentans TaxID=2772457 RepID=UPI001C0607DE|nr:DNA-binding transcriptional LysR family regulator [Pelorhabdus rhamnosifermentans]
MLYISQPTLTGRLQQIEELFGVQIVIRSKRGVSFTPEGTYLVECARKMLHEMHGIKETLQAMKQEVAGTLRIAASKSKGRFSRVI